MNIILPDYNKFTKDTFDAKIKKEKFTNESSLIEKMKLIATKVETKTLTTKEELKPEQDKTAKKETSELLHFIAT